MLIFQPFQRAAADWWQSAWRIWNRFCLLALVWATCCGTLNAGVSSSHEIDHRDGVFQRIATFPVFLNTGVDDETVAEIITSTKNGRLLLYTDSENKNIGFVDITDPAAPQADGTVDVSGEPTSVAVVERRGARYGLAVVNTSADFVNTSGVLKVIDIDGRQIVREIQLGGQPDSIAVSPNQRYAAIAIENERDEDLGDGRPPQSPPGFVVIVDLIGSPASWDTRTVELVGVPTLFPEDPEPEFIDINHRNIAAVTLQENNHVVLIHLRSGRIIRDWSAGTVDLTQIDTDGESLITFESSLSNVPREPDAVAWTRSNRLATADEGDLNGGSRGFTLFDFRGRVRFASGSSVEHAVARVGHYPEERSGNKGNEPEGVKYARYGFERFLFVGSERANVVAVYRLPSVLQLWFIQWLEWLFEGTFDWHVPPQLAQVLPAGVGPEGLHAIPHRGLFVVASEKDDRGDKFRSTITLYRLAYDRPSYPTVVSDDRENGTPIPWGALSALAADAQDPGVAYAAYDSFYKQSRIFRLDVSRRPAVITDEVVLRDGNGNTVDLDVEGLAVRADGGFWVASEGAGSVDAADRPVTSQNLLIQVAHDGSILQQVSLPGAVNDLQRRFGFEGVASVGSGADEFVYVVFQREWKDDPAGMVRVGRYQPSTSEWKFFYYPLDPRESPNEGWVGLSEVVAIDDDRFAVIERDNQGGTDARIKRIYEFSVAGIQPTAQHDPPFPVLSKSLVRDLIPDLQTDNGPVLEKVEGLTILSNGDVLIVTDNDGVDDATGETQLIHLGKVFDE